MLARQATWLEPALQLKVFKAYLARTPVVCSGSSMYVVPATSKAGQTIKHKLQFEHTKQLQTLQAQYMRSSPNLEFSKYSVIGVPVACTFGLYTDRRDSVFRTTPA